MTCAMQSAETLCASASLFTLGDPDGVGLKIIVSAEAGTLVLGDVDTDSSPDLLLKRIGSILPAQGKPAQHVFDAP